MAATPPRGIPGGRSSSPCLKAGVSVAEKFDECVAIQIDAGEGDYAKKPITYCLWKRQQLCYWPNPNKANEVEPGAVALSSA